MDFGFSSGEVRSLGSRRLRLGFPRFRELTEQDHDVLLVICEMRALILFFGVLVVVGSGCDPGPTLSELCPGVALGAQKSDVLDDFARRGLEIDSPGRGSTGAAIYNSVEWSSGSILGHDGRLIVSFDPDGWASDCFFFPKQIDLFTSALAAHLGAPRSELTGRGWYQGPIRYWVAVDDGFAIWADGRFSD